MQAGTGDLKRTPCSSGLGSNLDAGKEEDSDDLSPLATVYHTEVG